MLNDSRGSERTSLGAAAGLSRFLAEGDALAWILLLIAAFLFVLFIFPAWTHPIQDPDYWWLRWAGDEMLHGAYPRLNALSWTAPDTEWVTHEPLVELAYGLAGAGGIGWVRGAIVSATALLLGFIAWRRHSAVATVLAFAWVTQLVLYGRTERALSWGNLMLALTVALLHGRPSTWRFVGASLVVGLWASVHGSFVVGIFLIALASWRWGLVAAALTLVNPGGWRLWELVLGYGTSVGTKPFVHDAIPEWFVPNFFEPWTLFRICLLGAAGVLILWRGPWRGRITWAALTFLGMEHQRFMETAAIAALPWLASALDELLPKRAIPSPLPLFAAATIGLAVIAPPAVFDEARFPAGFPFAQLAGRRVWNDYVAGGYLGYHGVKVFWDPRVDCYPIDILNDGWKIEVSDADRLGLLGKWQIDDVVTSHAAIVTQLEHAGWIALGAYGQWRVFERPGDPRLRS